MEFNQLGAGIKLCLPILIGDSGRRRMLYGQRFLEASIVLAVGCTLELKTSFLVLEFGKQFRRAVRFFIKAFGGFRGKIVV